MKMTVVVALITFSTIAGAQEPTASIVPFPFEVLRMPPGTPKADEEALRLELPRLLLVEKINIPSPSDMRDALVALKRQDCDREDSCLQQLAQKAGTLYAVFASIDFTIDKNVVVTGRVVSDEGVLVRKPKSLTLPKGKAAFSTVATDALTRLLREFELTKLPATRPVAPVVPSPPPVTDVPRAATPAVAAKPTGEPAPIAPLVEASSGPSRALAYDPAGAGVVALGAGVIVFFAAPRIGFQGSNVATDDAKNVATAVAMQRGGSVVMGLGAAAVIAGSVLWALSPSPTTTVAVMPISGGGAVSVGGTFQ